MNRRDALKSLAAVPLVGMVKAEKHPIDGGSVVPFEPSGWSPPMLIGPEKEELVWTGLVRNVPMYFLLLVGRFNDSDWRGNPAGTVRLSNVAFERGNDGYYRFKVVFHRYSTPTITHHNRDDFGLIRWVGATSGPRGWRPI